MNWNPWRDYANIPEPQLPITAPPCPYCKSWRPHIEYRKDGQFDGVVCCTKNDQMCHDFSCYQARSE